MESQIQKKNPVVMANNSRNYIWQNSPYRRAAIIVVGQKGMRRSPQRAWVTIMIGIFPEPAMSL